MKPFTRDMTITLIIKIILLILLWWVCVKGLHPVLSSAQEWMLGVNDKAAFSENNRVR